MDRLEEFIRYNGFRDARDLDKLMPDYPSAREILTPEEFLDYLEKLQAKIDQVWAIPDGLVQEQPKLPKIWKPFEILPHE